MTGFGLAERPWSERSATVRIELRSVNARFLELKIRQPFGVAIEHALRKQLEARLGRGRVDLGVRVDEGGSQSDALADLGVESSKVASVLAAMSALTDAANQASFAVTHPTALDLLRFLIGLRGSSAAGMAAYEQVPTFLTELIDEACTRLLAMREQEGRALHGVLGGLLGELEQHVERLVAGLVGEADRLNEQLTSRVRALLERVGTDLDGHRVAQEIAIVVQRGDVSEELARIASHLDQARGVLAAPAEVGQGKTLDFLAQELLREVTTIGSKITSHDGANTVIAAKRTIERIREQVQNVE